MPDVRGKPMRAGDKIVYASTERGMTFGRLKYDEEDKRSYHVFTKESDGTEKLRYFQKPWRQGDKDKSMLNMTAYLDDLFDNPDLL